MRVVVCIIALIMALCVVAGAAEPGKVSVNAQDEQLSAVAARMSADAGVSIIVDPKASAKLTMSLNECDLPKALDVICKTTKLTWKKVQFAKSTDFKVTVDQIKSSIIALASMPLIAVSVQDGSGKGAALFARELPSSPDTASVTLPEGYTWATAYVIYNPTQPVQQAQTASQQPLADKETLSKMSSSRLAELASMTPEERKKAFASEITDLMTLVPEARKQVLKDQFTAAKQLDSKTRKQYYTDLRSALRGVIGGQKSTNTRSNRTQNVGKSKVIPAK